MYIEIAMVYPHIENQIFVHFHFQFEVDFTFNDIKVKNVRKITSIQELVVLKCNMYIISEK